MYVWSFTTGIGSCSYGGLEVPPPPICKLESQERWWCLSLSPETPMFQGKRRRKLSSPSLHHFVLFRPAMDWMTHTHIGEGIFVYLKKKNLMQKKSMMNKILKFPMKTESESCTYSLYRTPVS